MFCFGNFLLQIFEDFVKACPVGLTDYYKTFCRNQSSRFVGISQADRAGLDKVLKGDNSEYKISRTKYAWTLLYTLSLSLSLSLSLYIYIYIFFYFLHTQPHTHTHTHTHTHAPPTPPPPPRPFTHTHTINNNNNNNKRRRPKNTLKSSS